MIPKEAWKACSSICSNMWEISEKIRFHISDCVMHEGEGEVAFFSAKSWDRRNRADLIEPANPCDDAQVAGSCRVSNPLRLTVLPAKSGDYTTALQHLHDKLVISRFFVIAIPCILSCGQYK